MAVAYNFSSKGPIAPTGPRLALGRPSGEGTPEGGKYMKHQHGQRISTHATIWFFLTFFFIPFGYGEVGNSQDHRADPIVPGQFIVLLNRGIDPAQVASDHAAVPFHQYRVASRGFAARLSNAQANALRSDPRVNNVIADRKVTTAAKPATGAGGGSVELIPTGIMRIAAVGPS